MLAHTLPVASLIPPCSGLPSSTRLGSGILIYPVIEQSFQHSLCHLHLGRLGVGNWDISGPLSVAGIAHLVRTIEHLSTQTSVLGKEIRVVL